MLESSQRPDEQCSGPHRGCCGPQNPHSIHGRERADLSEAEHSERLIGEEFSIRSSDKDKGIDDIIDQLGRATESRDGTSKSDEPDEIKVIIKKKLPVKVPC